MLGQKARCIRELKLSLKLEQREAHHWWEVACGHKKEARLFDGLSDKGKIKRHQESNDILVYKIQRLRSERDWFREKFELADREVEQLQRELLKEKFKNMELGDADKWITWGSE